MEPWGDPLETSNKWPLLTENNTIRIIGQNVNGISYYNDYVEWEMSLNYMDEFQADIVCMCEVNLDLNKNEVMDNIYSRMKKIDPHARLSK